MTKTDVLDAINAVLVAHWPKRTVYVNVCPVDFDRPSFWLRATSDKVSDANRYTVKHELTLELVLYDEQDDHYEVHWERLDRDADEAAMLMQAPLAVGDRRLRLWTETLPRNPDEAVVRISTTWYDERYSGAGDPPPVADDADVSYRITLK